MHSREQSGSASGGERSPSAGRGPGGGRAAEARGLPWHKVDDLTATQVAAMQTMDDARRDGVLSETDAREIESLIRAGHVHGARKRVTLARKQARS